MEDDNVVELPMVTKKQFEHAADVMDQQVRDFEDTIERLKDRISEIRDAIDAWEEIDATDG